MKRLLFILLLLPSLAWGQDYARMNPYILGGGASAAACTTGTACTDVTHDYCNNEILLCEDFDGSTDCDGAGAMTENVCRGAWTVEAGTPNFDDTGNKTEGTNSLYVDGTVTNSTYIYRAVTSGNAAYAYFIFKLVAAPTSSGKIIFAYKTSGNNMCGINVNPNGTLLISHYGPAATTTAAMSAGNTYHVWSYCDVSGGTDHGVAWVAFSDSASTLPTSDNGTTQGYASLDNGDGTTAINRIGVGLLSTTDASLKMSYDHIRVSTTAIGANPP